MKGRGTPDGRIDRYLSKPRPWRPELRALREILLSEGLDEALKWRQPCYMAHGANVALLAAMTDAVAVSFFRGVLLDDPGGRLVPPGPNSRSARYMTFTSTDEIAADATLLRGFLRGAVEIARAGLRVETRDDHLELPGALRDALAGDPALAAGWDALTPGRRRGWVVVISGAKQEATRRRRVAAARAAILKGRGPHDRG